MEKNVSDEKEKLVTDFQFTKLSGMPTLNINHQESGWHSSGIYGHFKESYIHAFQFKME